MLTTIKKSFCWFFKDHLDLFYRQLFWCRAKCIYTSSTPKNCQTQVVLKKLFGKERLPSTGRSWHCGVKTSLGWTVDHLHCFDSMQESPTPACMDAHTLSSLQLQLQMFLFWLKGHISSHQLLKKPHTFTHPIFSSKSYIWYQISCKKSGQWRMTSCPEVLDWTRGLSSDAVSWWIPVHSHPGETMPFDVQGYNGTTVHRHTVSISTVTIRPLKHCSRDYTR